MTTPVSTAGALFWASTGAVATGGLPRTSRWPACCPCGPQRRQRRPLPNLNPATHGQLHAFVHAIAWPGYLGDHVFTKVADNFDAYLDSLFIDPDTAEDAWADVAGSDPSDPWRRTVEEWLDKELPAWRAEAGATPLT
ncbi:hypothetical protein [Streptomyces sp. R02]|uniref:Uncharacterized protein n=1 Tax=Streptomyces sp. R02 TaxID=3238623 RepID=A0AB39LE81_9ACTN